MQHKPWEIVKSLIIAALICSLLLLAVAVLPAETIRNHQWLSHLLQPMSPLLGMSQAELTYVQTELPVLDASQPTCISVRNESGRSTAMWDFTSLDQAFEAYGGLLGQALDTAGDFTETTQAHLLQILSGPSVLFSYEGRYSVSLLASWLEAELEAEVPAVQSCILAPENGVIRLHLVGDTIYEADTQVPAHELLALLDQAKPDGSRLAFEAGLSLNPLAAVPESTVQLSGAFTTNPCNGIYIDTLATELGFNPYSEMRYQSADGTTHFSEANCALHISAGGQVLLTSTAKDRFTASNSQEETLVELARQLVHTIGVPGAGRLYLSSVTRQEEETVCTFDYYCNAIPVALHTGAAATVTFSGTHVTELTMQVLRFTRAEEQLLPLPIAQVLPLLPPGAPLKLQYCITADHNLAIGWQEP